MTKQEIINENITKAEQLWNEHHEGWYLINTPYGVESQALTWYEYVDDFMADAQWAAEQDWQFYCQYHDTGAYTIEWYGSGDEPEV